jgi:hypothetical protein
MKWEPIATAPKDGRLLLLHNSAWPVSVLLGGWDTHEMAWRVHGFGCPAAQPTEWQERPAPPATPISQMDEE